ncbi:MAG: hypothetical protein QOJ87_1716, partial [Verrucomicrobiota bacterium]
ELKADVEKLAGEIGERNMNRYPRLLAAAEFIESSLTSAGYAPRRDTYELRGRACHNLEVEIPGATREILVIGAHYDSVSGCPGANDNGSGVAALLALARRFAGKPSRQTLRFVAFVNEEPPYFQTEEMGSFVYAKRCKERGDRITGMISLETIGYFSDAPGSQKYPSAGLGFAYPTTGNFIGFASDTGSRSLLRATVSAFRKAGKLPLRRRVVARHDSRHWLVGPLVVLAMRLSGDHGDGHCAVPLSALSRSDRHAGQARLRSVCAGGERDGERDRGVGEVGRAAFVILSGAKDL